MSELMNKQNNSQALRWKFLATASALALLGSAIDAAKASDDDQPVIWVELGGQLSRLDDGQTRFAPPFFDRIVAQGFTSPVTLERPPFYSIDEDGKISFQPEGSSWVLSVSVQYGRTDGKGNRNQQTNNPPVGLGKISPSQARHQYANTTTSHNETHDIFDFMAGKDVGLGMLGTNGTSILSGGIRFAQFRSKSSASVYSDPDYANPNTSSYHLIGPKYFHNFGANALNAKSFAGVGPSISWDASAPLMGQGQGGQLAFDWGLNGAVLFGRQKSKGSHQTNGKLTTGYANFPPYFVYHTTHYTHSLPHDRSRMATVPNIGAMAGLSFRYANAKISFGYRADLFFGAMDGGIDAARKENVGFYGPFASVSVGIGG